MRHALFFSCTFTYLVNSNNERGPGSMHKYKNLIPLFETFYFLTNNFRWIMCTWTWSSIGCITERVSSLNNTSNFQHITHYNLKRIFFALARFRDVDTFLRIVAAWLLVDNHRRVYIYIYIQLQAVVYFYVSLAVKVKRKIYWHAEACARAYIHLMYQMKKTSCQTTIKTITDGHISFTGNCLVESLLGKDNVQACKCNEQCIMQRPKCNCVLYTYVNRKGNALI